MTILDHHLDGFHWGFLLELKIDFRSYLILAVVVNKIMKTIIINSEGGESSQLSSFYGKGVEQVWRHFYGMVPYDEPCPSDCCSRA